MEVFKLDALSVWEGKIAGEVLQYDCGDARRVRFTVIANDHVEVWVAFKDGEESRDVLAASSAGMFEVEFSASGMASVYFLAPEETVIFMRGHAPDHTLPQTELESYTEIAPRERRNTDLDRIMMVMKLNERQREERYQADLAALQAQLAPAAPVALDQPAPAPAPAADAAE